MNGRPSPLLSLLLLGIAATGGCTSDGSTPAGGQGAARVATAAATDANAARGGVALGVAASTARRRSRADEPLEILLVARNATERTLELLLWNTPFEDTLSADLFTVTRRGEPIAYRGRLVKRATPPPASAFARLAPGATLERSVDLARAYAVDVPGTYVIRFSPPPVAADGGAATDDGSVRLVGDGRELVVERY